MKLISIVIPAYNEEGNIQVVADRISAIFESLQNQYQFELLFIDDGSKDKTLEVLKELHLKNPNIHYLSFARNFGHQSALRCGLDHANGDCVISMDADLQHPPHFIPLFLEKWEEGYDIVYTQRIEDKKLPFLKRITSKGFYRFINAMSDVKLEDGTADFRLMDRKAVNIIRNSPENDLFVRGFVAWMGFRQFKLAYKPDQRFSGTTKYTFKKMIKLAVNGITAFSTKPLRLATYLGLTISTLAFVYALYAIIVHFFTEEAVPGWTSVLVSVLIIGGLQLCTLGVIGEYLGRLFMQTKQRPDYIVREKTLH